MRPRIVWLLLALSALLAAPAGAVAVKASSSPDRDVRRIHADGELVMDVWTDRGDGAVYHTGDPIRVHFRASGDCYAVIYNVDTQGNVHLLYPYRPLDPHWVEGGREYVLPAPRSSYDLVVDGPPGIEYIQALASREPFQQLPDYMDPEYDPSQDGVDSETGWREGGHIVGDPYLGMERINRSILPYDCDEQDCYAAAYTSFYVERKVAYPRFLCNDCHGPNADMYHDPYQSVCSVFEIRVDYDWRWRRGYPYYHNPYWYYFRRADCAPRFYGYKQRWSSDDGWVRFKDTFDRRVLWKKNPGEDPKAGGGSGGYFTAPRGGSGKPRSPSKDERDRVRQRPVKPPVGKTPSGDETVRFRDRSHEVPGPPHYDRRPPVEKTPPAKPDDGGIVRRRREDPPTDRKGEGRVRDEVKPREEPRNPPRDEPRPAPREEPKPPPRDEPKAAPPAQPDQPKAQPRDGASARDRGEGRRFYGK